MYILNIIYVILTITLLYKLLAYNLIAVRSLISEGRECRLTNYLESCQLLVKEINQENTTCPLLFSGRPVDAWEAASLAATSRKDCPGDCARFVVIKLRQKLSLRSYLFQCAENVVFL